MRYQNFADTPLCILGVVEGLHFNFFRISAVKFSVDPIFFPFLKRNFAHAYLFLLFTLPHLCFTWVEMFSQPQKLRWGHLNLTPPRRGQRETEEGGSHSRPVGGRLNKPESSGVGLVLRARSWSRPLHLPARI